MPSSATHPLAAALTGPGLTALDAAADEGGFSGVISVEAAGFDPVTRCYGFAHRGHQIPVSPSHQFALASISKAFTALAVLRLVEDGALRLADPARDLLGSDLPLVDDAVTVEHLLGHTSGVGDYLDEDEWDPDGYVLQRPVQDYTGAEAFLPDLSGHPQRSAPGMQFRYNNAGYLILAVLAERVSGLGFHELVQREVLDRAGLTQTAYLRSDALPPAAATGYLAAEGDRTNVLHLPVRGGGDGGAYATAGDLHRFWLALTAGEIVRPETVALMTRPRHKVPEEGLRYGLGFWLRERGPGLVLEGCDAGVSARTTHDPTRGLSVTVLGNTTMGAWPVIAELDRALG